MVRIRHAALVFVVAVAALVASAAAPARTAASAAPAASALAAQPGSASATACGRGFYKNVSGHCVKRPGSDPSGATARCGDGSYSYSEHASGTCSHHGGVARWLHHP